MVLRTAIVAWIASACQLNIYGLGSWLVVGYAVCALIERLRSQAASLAQANKQLHHYASTLEELAISRERNRMARELHDTLAHTLSGLTVQMEAVKAYWEVDPPTAKALQIQALDTLFARKAYCTVSPLGRHSIKHQDKSLSLQRQSPDNPSPNSRPKRRNTCSFLRINAALDNFCITYSLPNSIYRIK